MPKEQGNGEIALFLVRYHMFPVGADSDFCRCSGEGIRCTLLKQIGNKPRSDSHKKKNKAI